MRKALSLCLRFLVLGLALMIAQMVAIAAVGTAGAQMPKIDPQAAVKGLAIARVSGALVLGFVALRSSWSGLRLAVALSFVQFTVETFLSQIESVAFLTGQVAALSLPEIWALVLRGAVFALFVGPLTVLIMGKARGQEPGTVSLGLSRNEWVKRLSIIAVSYICIYLGFGLFVAKPLAGAAFDQFYTTVPPMWWLIPFQAVRSLIWTLAALPVVLMTRAPRWEAALQVGLLFSVLMGFLLFIPNPFMPDTIRIAHLVEVCSSNFVFGCLVAIVLTGKKGAENKALSVT